MQSGFLVCVTIQSSVKKSFQRTTNLLNQKRTELLRKKFYYFVNEQDTGLNLTIYIATCSQKDQEGKLENVHKGHSAKGLEKGWNYLYSLQKKKAKRQVMKLVEQFSKTVLICHS